MWSLLRRGRRLTLAGQFLALQVVVLLVVLALASIVSLRQSDAEFADQRGASLRGSAQQLANIELVRTSLGQRPVFQSLQSYVATTQDRTEATSVVIAAPDGEILVALDPDEVGEQLPFGESDVRQLRTWTGDLEVDGQRSIAVQVPVIRVREGRAPELMGIVMVSEPYPTLADRAREWFPDLVTFLGFGLLVGVAGSWLLSRLIRRRTRGLEPPEIAALADSREAMLHAIREGVVAVSADGVVTVLSDSARDLLGLGSGVQEGQRLADLDLDRRVLDALGGEEDIHDGVLVVDGRLLVLNRNGVRDGGRQVGTVSTLRDRTELLAMQREMSAREGITETLRAQTHEFQNQLHTISGLVQLEEYDEVSRLVGTLTRRRAEISDAVTSRVDDPAVAALLIAKVSLAGERGVELDLSQDSALPRLDHELSGDVGTVLGNLVDNAVDATVAAGGERIDVHLAVEGDAVLVRVSDSGAGVPAEEAGEIFRRGYSTKEADAAGRGVGLALVQVVCERRGGTVSVHNDGGAVFTARLPTTGGAP